MGYHVALDGTLALTAPVPRETFAGSHWRVSTLGTLIECPGECDWREAISQLRGFVERDGVGLLGELKVVGEDGAHLADVSAKGADLRIVEHELPDDSPTLDDWVSELTGSDEELRQIAARELVAFVEPRTVEVLERALAGASDGLTQVVLESLGELGALSVPAFGTVRALLDHPNPVVRYWATHALGRMGPTAAAALPELEQMTAETEPGPKYGALDAIKRITGST